MNFIHIHNIATKVVSGDTHITLSVVADLTDSK